MQRNVENACKLTSKGISLQSVTDSDYRMELIIFESLLTTFELYVILEAAGKVAKNWLDSRSKPPCTTTKISFPKSVTLTDSYIIIIDLTNGEQKAGFHCLPDNE
jgi:hypothetical protein